jgi:hypothetical protein
MDLGLLAIGQEPQIVQEPEIELDRKPPFSHFFGDGTSDLRRNNAKLSSALSISNIRAISSPRLAGGLY